MPQDWLLPGAWAEECNAADQEHASSCFDSTDSGWATSSGPQTADSDPLVSTAQQLLAAVPAAVPADCHALLTSGAVLLLGHGSTTIAGSNTTHAAVDELEASSALLEGDMECRSHVLSTSTQSGLPGLGIPGPIAEGHEECRTTLSEAGMQQLVAAVGAVQLHCASDLQHTQPGQHQQQQALLQHGLERAGTPEASQVGQQQLQGSPNTTDSCSSKLLLPASAEVLVLGDCESENAEDEAGEAPTDPCDSPRQRPGLMQAAAHLLQSWRAAYTHTSPQCAAGAASGTAASAAPPLLQLLSCSSLGSSGLPVGRSSSSLLQGYSLYAHSSVLRLGSLSAQSCSREAGAASSRESSVTSQRPGSVQGQAAALAAAQVAAAAARAAAAEGATPSGPPAAVQPAKAMNRQHVPQSAVVAGCERPLETGDLLYLLD